MDEVKALKRRVSAVEAHVGRLIQAITGMQGVIDTCSQLPNICGQCSLLIDEVETCPEDECPCGLN